MTNECYTPRINEVPSFQRRQHRDTHVMEDGWSDQRGRGSTTAAGCTSKSAFTFTLLSFQLSLKTLSS